MLALFSVSSVVVVVSCLRSAFCCAGSDRLCEL